MVLPTSSYRTTFEAFFENLKVRTPKHRHINATICSGEDKGPVINWTKQCLSKYQSLFQWIRFCEHVYRSPSTCDSEVFGVYLCKPVNVNVRRHPTKKEKIDQHEIEFLRLLRVPGGGRGWSYILASCLMHHFRLATWVRRALIDAHARYARDGQAVCDSVELCRAYLFSKIYE